MNLQSNLLNFAYMLTSNRDDAYDLLQDTTLKARDLPEPFSMHVAGYKYEEIAQQLSLPLGTVKSRIYYARKRLQERFADYR